MNQEATIICSFCESRSFFAMPDGADAYLLECASCGRRSEISAGRGVTLALIELPDEPEPLLRRHRVDLFTPAERAIYDAVQAVEAMTADVRLTDAVVLLQAARDSVADYVDGIESRRYVSTSPNGTPARDAVPDRPTAHETTPRETDSS